MGTDSQEARPSTWFTRGLTHLMQHQMLYGVDPIDKCQIDSLQNPNGVALGVHRSRFCSRESRKFQQLSTRADSSMLNLKDFARAAGYRTVFQFPDYKLHHH